jgi:hypothetical protein
LVWFLLPLFFGSVILLLQKEFWTYLVMIRGLLFLAFAYLSFVIFCGILYLVFLGIWWILCKLLGFDFYGSCLSRDREVSILQSLKKGFLS